MQFSKVCIAIITSLMILSSGCISQKPKEHEYGNYDYKISRNFDNESEEKALFVAEHTNYSEILGSHAGSFIDNIKLQNYTGQYYNFKNQSAKHDVKFNYTANVEFYENISINYNRTETYQDPYYPYTNHTYSTKELVIYSNSMKIYDSHEKLKLRYFNGTNWTIAYGTLQLNFSKCYIVETTFEYSDTWGPIGGYGDYFYQLVIIDKNFKPILIGSSSVGWIS